MRDLKNAGKYYWHYLKKYWFGFLVTAILIGISTACIVIAPTYLGRAVSELTTYLQQWTNTATRGDANLGSFHKTLWVYLALYLGDASTLFIASMILARITAYSLVRCVLGYSVRCNGCKYNILILTVMGISWHVTLLIWITFLMR